MVANENCNNKKFSLKLIHLFWIILVAAILTGVAWGVMHNQQSTNSKKIDTLDTEKVEKDIFQMHMNQQQQQFESLEKTIDSGFDKVATRLDKIEAKE
jgi:uncharacterized protein HemX